MVDLGVLPAFVAVILLFLLPPGPDMAYMVAVGLHRGRTAAVRAILGIGTGMGVHVVAVVAGLGGVARAHPHVLEAVQVVGATYLFWLAFTTFRGVLTGADDPALRSSERPYVRGVMVSLTNPKVLIFFVAVLPQFLGDAQHVTAQLLLLGVTDVVAEVLLYGAIGVLAATVHAHPSSGRRARTAATYLAGTVYLALGGVVAAEVLVT